MPNLLMLDSGAFSVWNSGAEISIDDYLGFCKEHPGISYYVNLDVIPGSPGSVINRTPELIETACRKGWDNYLKMISVLPMEKVIPVFHRGENIRWLEKMLDFGCPYIGIGQLGIGSEDGQKAWLDELKGVLFDPSTKRPKVKLHGFAVTGWEMMNYIPWHSVDSASWVRQSSYGTVYIPFRRNNEWAYNQRPFNLNCSPKSPSRDEIQKHITTLSPTVKDMVMDYIREINMKLGTFEIVDVPDGYKRQDGELWYDKSKSGKILKILEKGLTTCHQRRFFANARFIHRANDVIDVDHIYFAGAVGSVLDNIEYRLKRRLISYHTAMDSKRCQEVLRKWEELAQQS